MIEIKGLKNGNVEYWDNGEDIKNLLKQIGVYWHHI